MTELAKVGYRIRRHGTPRDGRARRRVRPREAARRRTGLLPVGAIAPDVVGKDPAARWCASPRCAGTRRSSTSTRRTGPRMHHRGVRVPRRVQELRGEAHRPLRRLARLDRQPREVRRAPLAPVPARRRPGRSDLARLRRLAVPRNGLARDVPRRVPTARSRTSGRTWIRACTGTRCSPRRPRDRRTRPCGRDARGDSHAIARLLLLFRIPYLRR